MTLYPGARWRPTRYHGQVMSGHLGLILHVQGGDGSPYGWFQTAGSNVSSTLWVGKPGAVEQYVDADVAAWAQGAGNPHYNSVETEGQDTEYLTGEQLEQLARIYAWGHRVYGWPFRLAEAPGERGFGWHGMGGQSWGGHLYCPGEKRKSQRQAVLNRAQQLITGGIFTMDQEAKDAFTKVEQILDGVIKRESELNGKLDNLAAQDTAILSAISQSTSIIEKGYPASAPGEPADAHYGLLEARDDIRKIMAHLGIT